MKLTKEQKEIINSNSNIRINAIAGSGKTTTVIEYAASRPKESKILYLVFNKSVKTEAIHKFQQKGLKNVKVETAHSLAHRSIVRKYNYKVCQGYKSHELVPLLDLFEDSQRHGVYILANHINKLVAYYCNSDAERVSDLKYIETLTDPKAKGFVTKYLDTIVEKAEYFIERMDKAEIDITHDFYLKNQTFMGTFYTEPNYVMVDLGAFPIVFPVKKAYLH